ncbi:MAG: thioesterase family protein [Actinobacteria bacterium]|nr:thioesterase family protein [Actinomycetota bacterium]
MTALSAGLTGEARRIVTHDLTAAALGSGDVQVFGTPALLALIEEAAVASLHGSLDEGMTSVGASVTLEHLAPSHVGNEVRAIARLVAVDGKRLSFECEAYDGDTLIGRASHVRVVVARARFAR